MTTYYGVWSGKEWCWEHGGELFYTPALGVAKAQAMVTNQVMRRDYGLDPIWEARVIGEDGLPAEPQSVGLGICELCGEPATQAWSSQLTHGRTIVYHHRCDRHTRGPRVTKPPSLTEEQKEIRAEAASYQCAWCADVAMGWVSIGVSKWYHCDRCESWARESSRNDRLHKRREL